MFLAYFDPLDNLGHFWPPKLKNGPKNEVFPKDRAFQGGPNSTKLGFDQFFSVFYVDKNIEKFYKKDNILGVFFHLKQR